MASLDYRVTPGSDAEETRGPLVRFRLIDLCNHSYAERANIRGWNCSYQWRAMQFWLKRTHRLLPLGSRYMASNSIGTPEFSQAWLNDTLEVYKFYRFICLPVPRSDLLTTEA